MAFGDPKESKPCCRKSDILSDSAEAMIRALSLLLLAWTKHSAARPSQCPKGLSLLAKRSFLHKALRRKTQSDFYWFWVCEGVEIGMRPECVPNAGNCLYTTPSPMGANASGCGSFSCHCVTVPPGQCTEEALPGYHIVQNGAVNLMTGPSRWNESEVDHRVWEEVAGPGNHACRGDNSSDNDPKHYKVFNDTYSLSGCQSKCESTWGCVGIEYSYGRCEIWTRFQGLYAIQEISAEIGEFTCMRYGWPVSKLKPIDMQGNASHPCRGRSPNDNTGENYVLARKSNALSFRDIEECKAMCSATARWEYNSRCTGIEWSPGRCELWQVMIEAVNPAVSGFSCLNMTT
ncbi:hypothetical protein AK812_SmicGene39960 [Symbiodinium microadriaticum]|uniref:Uncharacterized protein n=1 Tax=Symbiodinium microadriaticum TaxID=2951 RepID=A0A1Q9C9U9_SYMMI|nr:hypothetical protein AK812_SmicGene39960 [Symbiodinium microadriaticum]CAE7876720.1 unnamed protein product [Symbiodinium microadriaticum]CAE7944739.1 unnamed protein product [Symbiodinium sp. KB8]